MEEARVLIAADNPRVRKRLAEILNADGLEAQTLTSSSRPESTSLTSKDVILLETNDDVASLMQTVYGLYSACSGQGVPQIIAFVSSKAVKRNPKLAGWDIDGHAVLAALIFTDDLGAATNLPYFIRRLKAIV